jgi:hypothetical protein
MEVFPVAELTDSLTELLDGRTSQISRRIGADESQTRTAVHAAVPTLLAALSTESSGGGLRQAVERDHDGSIIDQLSEYLDGSAQLNPRATDGDGILDHALGDRRAEVQQALSAKSGLDLGTIAKLLPLLAPILMGMLGKRSGGGTGGSGGSGGFGLDDIGDLLNREKDDARSTNPDIGDILDRFDRRGTGGGSSSGGIGDILDSLGGRDRDR